MVFLATYGVMGIELRMREPKVDVTPWRSELLFELAELEEVS